MSVHAIFARFGRQNRVCGQNATEREKRRDWLAEKIGFEPMVAFRRTIAPYWPTKCVFRLSAANGESKPRIGQTGQCRQSPKVNSCHHIITGAVGGRNANHLCVSAPVPYPTKTLPDRQTGRITVIDERHRQHLESLGAIKSDRIHTGTSTTSS